MRLGLAPEDTARDDTRLTAWVVSLCQKRLTSTKGHIAVEGQSRSTPSQDKEQ